MEEYFIKIHNYIYFGHVTRQLDDTERRQGHDQALDQLSAPVAHVSCHFFPIRSVLIIMDHDG